MKPIIIYGLHKVQVLPSLPPSPFRPAEGHCRELHINPPPGEGGSAEGIDGSDMVLEAVLFSAAAYISGSIPFGSMIARRVARIDITRRGSGNVGATNVARELGIRWGVLTLVLDALKGFIPVSLFCVLVPGDGPGYGYFLPCVALAALLGHQFSLFMGFRGGKGVATALGVFLAIDPVSCLIALVVFLGTVAVWDFVSLGSMVSSLAIPVLMAVFGRPAPLVIGALSAAALICLKHHENIGRLLRGEERKWRAGKRQPSTSSSLSSSSSE